ncbi:hypothetical protein AB3X52_14430 [Nocardioides sp. DS6]|uniref:PepSY domain-containing protein n=1 Tax=Nocardioides eburneus TaxID=3231482 RepID=A0ABV3T209_9ACTN
MPLCGLTGGSEGGHHAIQAHKQTAFLAKVWEWESMISINLWVVHHQATTGKATPLGTIGAVVIVLLLVGVPYWRAFQRKKAADKRERPPGGSTD